MPAKNQGFGTTFFQIWGNPKPDRKTRNLVSSLTRAGFGVRSIDPRVGREYVYPEKEVTLGFNTELAAGARFYHSTLLYNRKIRIVDPSPLPTAFSQPGNGNLAHLCKTKMTRSTH